LVKVKKKKKALRSHEKKKAALVKKLASPKNMNRGGSIHDKITEERHRAREKNLSNPQTSTSTGTPKTPGNALLPSGQLVGGDRPA